MYHHFYLFFCFFDLAVSQLILAADHPSRLVPRTNSRNSSPPSRSDSSLNSAVKASTGVLLETARNVVDSDRSTPPRQRPRGMRAIQTPPRRVQRNRSGSPKTSSAVSGHPNSAMVVATGPGALQIQRVGHETITEEVDKGQVKILNAKNDHGAFASALVGEGGSATTAATGNAAAGYVGAGKPGSGYVETYRGDTHRRETATDNMQKHLHAAASSDGVPRAAALSHVEGNGHVTAVGSAVDLPQSEQDARRDAEQLRRLATTRKYTESYNRPSV